MTDFLSIDSLVSLKGRRAVITGAGAGIGEAISRRFAEAGADLELVDIHEDKIRKVRSNLGEQFPNVTVRIHRLNVGSEDDIQAFWSRLGGEETSASPDILVNNAGIYPFQDFLETTGEDLERTMTINFKSVFWMCQHFVRARRKLGGAIINLSSIETILPFKDDLSHYSASKAGVLALTRSLAREYSGDGIRANAILPGGIMTEGTKKSAKEVLKFKVGLVKDGINFMSRLPLGRPGQPDEVARICLVLASDLSAYMTGAAVPVDGGFLSA